MLIADGFARPEGSRPDAPTATSASPDLMDDGEARPAYVPVTRTRPPPIHNRPDGS
ncbi:hypothetical protein ACIOKD_36305 [Streptomyces sp. NPDC087844]|uniref:hypothetical protein n=1 Tax=Streptomyces sp. NPDC087844 TaxID=3365805 RepID=UPI0038023BEF